MVKYFDGGLDAVFHALADPNRRHIVEALSHGERTVGEVAAPLSISLPAVSKHIGVLERAGLLRRRRDGRVHRLRFQPDALARGSEWIETHRRFWEESFDRLAGYLEKHSTQRPDKH